MRTRIGLAMLDPEPEPEPEKPKGDPLRYHAVAYPENTEAVLDSLGLHPDRPRAAPSSPQCFYELYGRRCRRPAGHEGLHESEFEVGRYQTNRVVRWEVE